jgi:hypothetical protein
MNEEDLHTAFVAEMLAVRDQQVTLKLIASPADLVGLLGIFQMCLRHPANTSTGAWNQLVQLAGKIEELLARYGPATARICSMGWSRENDRPGVGE